MVDTLLYPANFNGLAHVAVLAVAVWLIQFLHYLFADLLDDPRGVLIVVGYAPLAVAYTAFYFSCCVLDSSRGGIRAPAIWPLYAHYATDLFSQLLLFAAGLAMCAGPVAVYYLIMRRVDLWLCLAALPGAFLLPLMLLKATLFEDIEVLNPIGIFRSALATLPAYLSLILRFHALSILAAAIYWSGQLSSLPAVLFNAGCLYVLLIAGYQLGRFYWRQKDRLQWDL